jgi:hypothetical protein
MPGVVQPACQARSPSCPDGRRRALELEKKLSIFILSRPERRGIVRQGIAFYVALARLKGARWTQ